MIYSIKGTADLGPTPEQVACIKAESRQRDFVFGEGRLSQDHSLAGKDRSYAMQAAIFDLFDSYEQPDTSRLDLILAVNGIHSSIGFSLRPETGISHLEVGKLKSKGLFGTTYRYVGGILMNQPGAHIMRVRTLTPRRDNGLPSETFETRATTHEADTAIDLIHQAVEQRDVAVRTTIFEDV